MKAKHKLFGYVVDVIAVYSSDGDFLYYQDKEEELNGEPLRYIPDMLEPLEEPNWMELEVETAQGVIKEIIRYDQGANTYEATAKEAMGYAKALVMEFKKRWKEYNEEFKIENKEEDKE